MSIVKKNWRHPVLVLLCNSGHIERRIENLRGKIIKSAQIYRNNPTPENCAVVEAYAGEKLRVQRKYNVMLSHDEN